jgi:copper homeostasis protein
MPAILEVAVHHARDVPGAVEGGADRLALVAPGQTTALSPDLATASSVIRATDLPVRVLLRLDESLSVTGGQFVRLVGLAEKCLSLGAEGVVFGFLDGDLRVDLDTCGALTTALPEVPWTFHRAVDAVLEPVRAWRDLARLAERTPLTAVRSGGSPQGLGVGFDDLLALAQGSPDVARLLMPGGGLLAEHVPWFLRAGVSQFHIGAQARPGGTDRSYVDADLVRSWRRLIDAESARASTA